MPAPEAPPRAAMAKRLKMKLVELSGHLPARRRGAILDSAAFLIFKVARPLRRAVPLHLLRRLPFPSTLLGPPKGLCPTTERCCRETPGASYHALRPAVEVVRPDLPFTLEPEVHPVFIENRRTETPGTFVGSIPGARVYGDCGAVITPGDRLLADVSFEVMRRGLTHSAFNRFRLPRVDCAKLLKAVALSSELPIRARSETLPSPP